MSKNRPSPVRKLLAVVVVGLLSGCAAAYHHYSGCCIPYRYCAAPPLPYVDYEGCHCPTAGAAEYSRQQSDKTVRRAVNSAVPTVAPAPPEPD